jgi:hypothetical protein
MTCKMHRGQNPGNCSYQRDENYTCLQSLNHCLLAEDMMMDARDTKEELTAAMVEIDVQQTKRTGCGG